LQSQPFKFDASYVADVVSNLYGGKQTGTKYLGLANLKAGFNTENAGLWSGGMFYLKGANTHGEQPTSELIGDYQTVSNIEADPMTYVHELWFSQQLGPVNLTAGIQDLNNEMVNSPFAGHFLNSSFGIPPTISGNIHCPIFPQTAYGILLKWDISNQFTILTSVFEGNFNEENNRLGNLKPSFNNQSGYQIYTECHYKINPSLPLEGTYKMGSFYHNHKDALSTTTGTISYLDDFGFYLLADQWIVRTTNSNRGLGAFVQISICPKSRNDCWQYVGCGLIYQGIWKTRVNDILCLGMAHARINHQAIDHETAFELSYKAHMSKNVFIQPDFQYIVHPAAEDSTADLAMVATVRVGIQF